MKVSDIIEKIMYQPVMVRLWSDRTLHLLCTDTSQSKPSTLNIRINDHAHLERFEQVQSWQTRDQFLASCKDHIAEGILIFTVADETGPLLGYGLARADASDSLYTYVRQRVIWPEKTGVIYGGFVHPSARGRRIHAALQNARISHLIGELGMRWVISAVESRNQAAMQSARKTSLHPIADLHTRYRFGKACKHAVRHDYNFPLSIADEQK